MGLNEVRMKERGVRKKMNGVVVGTHMEKTVVVLVNRLKKHKTYSKYMKKHSKYLVHDPKNRCRVGDKVKIIESRPISKNKRWQLIEIIERGEMGELEQSIDQVVE